MSSVARALEGADDLVLGKLISQLVCGQGQRGIDLPVDGDGVVRIEQRDGAVVSVVCPISGDKAAPQKVMMSVTVPVIYCASASG